MYFLEKLTGLGENDGVQVNAVFTAICLMMGVWPCIYSALLIPSARSDNKASQPNPRTEAWSKCIRASYGILCRHSTLEGGLSRTDLSRTPATTYRRSLDLAWLLMGPFLGPQLGFSGVCKPGWRERMRRHLRG